MKKYLLLAAAAVAAAACAKEAVITDSQALVSKQFEASFNDLDTRTAIAYESGVYKVSWNAGDEIAVYDDVNPGTAHIFTASQSGATTTFSGSVASGASKFHAVYPASAALGCNFQDGVLSVNVPATQHPVQAGVDGDALVTVAYSESSSFEFRHVCSLLKFTLSGSENITAVQIRANGEECFSGATTVTYSEAPTRVISSAYILTLKPASGTTFTSGTYYAAVLPVEIGSGIKVTLSAEDKGCAIKSASSPLSMQRCSGLDLGTLAGWTFGRAVHIGTAGDLQALWKSGGCESLNENDVVYLDADIELTKSTRSCEDTFTATFDGQGHTITVNYSGTAKYPAPFKIVTGTIRNTNFAGSYTCKNRTSKDEVRVAGVAANLNNKGLIENCHVTTDLAILDDGSTNVNGQASEIGGIVGFIQAAGGTVQDCTYNGTITFEASELTNGRQAIIGGIAGGSGNSTTGLTIIRNCHSEGTIIQRQYYNSWGYVGGICGRPGASQYLMVDGEGFYNILEGCSSAMTIQLEGQKTRCGGIVGVCNGAFLVSGCNFSGKITMGPNNTGEQLAGGIVGISETTRDGIIENCTFSGTIDDSDGNSSQKSWTGGICTTGFAATSIIRNCRTTPDCLVVNTRGNGSSALVAARPNTAITIRDCKVAGTVIDAIGGYVTIDSQAALDANPWVVTGRATSAKVKSINNIYSE